MTSSLRGLLLCTALVLLLLLGWVLGGRGADAPRAPQLMALVPSEVRELRFTTPGRKVLRDGVAVEDDQALRLVRKGGGWESDQGAPVRAAAVEDLLGVVAAARWHRRAEAGRAGEVTHAVTIDGATLGVGEALGEQRWLVVRGQALLVDGWVARVLAADPTAWLERAVLPGAARSPVIELHAGAAPWHTRELVMQGDSLVSPWRHRLDAQQAQLLRQELEALEVLPGAARDGAGAASSPQAPDGGGRWSIRIAQGPSGEATLSGEGPCPTDPQAIAVTSSILGRGCVAGGALIQLGRQLDRVATSAGAEARPFAASAADIAEWQLADGRGGALRMWRDGGRWRAQQSGEGEPFAVEDAAIEEALAAWTSPWQVSIGAVRLPSSGSRTFEAPPPGGAASGTRTKGSPADARAAAITAAVASGRALSARRRDGTRIELALGRTRHEALFAYREGEELSLAAPPQIAAALGGAAAALTIAALRAQISALDLWQLEPTSIVRLVLDGRAVVRGAVVGEWLDGRGRPLPPARAAAVEELVGRLASLRARSRRPHGAGAAHRVELWIAADPSRTVEPGADGGGGAAPGQAQGPHRVELAARRGECLGRGDGAEARFEAGLCAQVGAVAALLR